MAGGRVICIGAVNMDRSYAVTRVVREGEAMNCSGYKENWGGKGLNQVVALRCAGMEPLFYAKVGKRDYEGLKAFLVSKNVDASHIIPVEGHTNHGVIQVTPEGRTAIIGVPNRNVSFTLEEMEEMAAEIGEGDILLLQNEIDHVPHIIRRARKKGCLIVLNPSPLCEEMAQWPLELVDMLILNEDEGQALTGKKDTQEILSSLRVRCPKSRIVLTLGERGSVFLHGSERIEQPGFLVEAVDTIAAGDTFTGYFMAHYIETGSVAASLRIAAKAAAMVVGRQGAAEVIPVMEDVLYN